MPLQVWSPTDGEGITGPPPPYLLVPQVGDLTMRIEQLRMGAELMRAGLHLFHSSTTAMGSVGVIRDGEITVTMETSGDLAELSSEESVKLASDDGRYEGNEGDLYE